MKKISVIVFIEYKIISRISIDSHDRIYIMKILHKKIIFHFEKNH